MVSNSCSTAYQKIILIRKKVHGLGEQGLMALTLATADGKASDVKVQSRPTRLPDITKSIFNCSPHFLLPNIYHPLVLQSGFSKYQTHLHSTKPDNHSRLQFP
jgi:hypothetical protein